jgi:hypothetical protein
LGRDVGHANPKLSDDGSDDDDNDDGSDGLQRERLTYFQRADPEISSPEKPLSTATLLMDNSTFEIETSNGLGPHPLGAESRCKVIMFVFSLNDTLMAQALLFGENGTTLYSTLPI